MVGGITLQADGFYIEQSRANGRAKRQSEGH